MKILSTERLELREWQLGDVDDLYEYAKDERVGPSAGWSAHQNKEESQRILEMFIKDGDVWAVVLKSENKVIGSIGLHERSPEEADPNQKEIGYVLSPTYWGQGLMPEAVHEVIRYGFEEEGLQRLWVGYYDFNQQSKRVVEKCGFTYRFTKPKVLELLDGRVVQQLFYSMSKEEYNRK